MSAEADARSAESGIPKSERTTSPDTAVAPDYAALVNQLACEVQARVLDPLDLLFVPEVDPSEELATLRQRLQAAAHRWAAELLGPDPRLAARTAARIIAALHPGDVRFDPPASWWQTPFGRVVAGRLGHPTAESVSFAVAGAMLGMTRQGVHDLVSRGRLRRHPEGGVSAESVRARINRHG